MRIVKLAHTRIAGTHCQTLTRALDTFRLTFFASIDQNCQRLVSSHQRMHICHPMKKSTILVTNLANQNIFLTYDKSVIFKVRIDIKKQEINSDPMPFDASTSITSS